MFKIKQFIFINILFSLFSLTQAKEPFLAILTKTESNEIQIFRFSSYTITCSPYGVTSLEKLYFNSKDGSSCKKSIELFYRKNPQAEYYWANKLKVMQMYHIEIKPKSCVVHVDGLKTYSELLLENGLAIKKPFFDDYEYNAVFTKAQTKAKNLKIGFWSEQLFNDCIAESYK